MLALKPPGVSGSRISTITSLCIANVQVRTLTPSLSDSMSQHTAVTAVITLNILPRLACPSLLCSLPYNTNQPLEFSPSQSSSRGFSPTSRKLLALISLACSTS